MSRKTKNEPDLKVVDFINKSNDQSSSEDEPLELVIQKVRRPHSGFPTGGDKVPDVETHIVNPISQPVVPKRIRKKYPKKETQTLNPSPTTPPVPPSTPDSDYLAEVKTLREELERAKKGLHEVKKENISIRKNDLDTRREMMRLRFG